MAWRIVLMQNKQVFPESYARHFHTLESDRYFSLKSILTKAQALKDQSKEHITGMDMYRQLLLENDGSTKDRCSVEIPDRLRSTRDESALRAIVEPFLGSALGPAFWLSPYSV